MLWNRLNTLMLLVVVALAGSLVDARLALRAETERVAALTEDLDDARTRLRAARQHVAELDDRVDAVRTAAHRVTTSLATRIDDLNDQLVDSRSRRTRVRDYLVDRFGLDRGRAGVMAGHLVDAAARARQRYDVSLDATLLAAQMSTESSFDPDARSGAGALGLMQVMPFHVKRYDFLHERVDLLNPRLNVRAGAFVLAEAMAAHDDPRAALRAYHGGPDAVASPKQVTRAYVETVMRRWARLS